MKKTKTKYLRTCMLFLIELHFFRNAVCYKSINIREGYIFKIFKTCSFVAGDSVFIMLLVTSMMHRGFIYFCNIHFFIYLEYIILLCIQNYDLKLLVIIVVTTCILKTFKKKTFYFFIIMITTCMKNSNMIVFFQGLDFYQ